MHVEGKRDRRIAVGSQFLLDERHGPEIRAEAAIFLGHDEPGEAALFIERHQLEREFVFLVRRRTQFGEPLGKLARARDQLITLGRGYLDIVLGHDSLLRCWARPWAKQRFAIPLDALLQGLCLDRTSPSLNSSPKCA